VTVQIVLLYLTILVLPGFLLYRLWKGQEASLLKWLLRVSFTGLFFIYIFMAGRWDWASYYLRYIWLLLYVVGAVASYRRIGEKPLFAVDGRRRWLGLTSHVFTLLVSLFLVGSALRGHIASQQPVRLALPLEDGRYYVAQGGNALILNYAANSRSQQFALDIVELNTVGARARGIYPSQLERYTVFGEPIHSPCDGTVAATRDGLPDLAPGERDPENPAGNHVIISCRNVDILLAHMKNGSVDVDHGVEVETGDALGRVGNSGNTTEPHLHIHAVEGGSASVFEGDGVPIFFGRQLPTRNSLFVQ